MGYIRQQIKQRIQEQSTCILLYNMFYYSSILMYQEITIKSFTCPTVIILHIIIYDVLLIIVINRFHSQ